MVCFSSSLSTLIIRSTSRKTTTCAYTQQQRQRLHHFVNTQSFQHRNFSSTKIPDSFSSVHNHDSNEIDDDDDEIIENHHQKQQKQKQQKKINIAIVGLPNAGKSFLLNRICQSKHVAAVSKKRHTTRHGILGVRNMDETQLVFVDTPGFLRSKSDANSSSSSEKQNEKLMRSLVATAGAEINKADYTLLVLDSAANKMNFKEYEDSLLILMWKGMFGDGQTQSSQLRQYNDSMNSIPTLPPSTLGVILNKVDLVTPKKKLLDTATEIGSMALACIQYYYLLNETSLTTTGDNDNNSELQKQLSVEDHIRNMKQNHPKWQKTKSENLIEKLEQELDIDPDEQKHLEEEISDDGLDGSKSGEDNDELSKAVDMPENFLQALNEPDKYFTKEMQQHYPDVFFTSAKHKDGIDDILNHLQKIAPIREWDYEGDDASPDRSPLQKVEEIIREKIYRAVHREIPHQVDQVNRVFNFREIAIPTTSEDEEKQQQEELQSNTDNQRKKVLEIHQDLVVRSRSHQRILKGKNNMTLQRLHEQTKKDIETLFGCPVILHLHVKKTKSKQDLSNSPDSSSLLIGDDNMPW